MNPYLERLFNVSPYEGLNPDDHPSDVHGWENHSVMFAKLAKDAKLVVECGAWKGRGTIALAAACPNATIISIDTFLGSEEMWTNKDDPERYGALRLKNGYPTLFYEFLSNIMRAGLQDRVVPMPLPTDIGLSILRGWNEPIDMVFIDADHSYLSVKRDIIAALALEPRIICGDDHQPGWPGVVQAVDELLPNAQHFGVFWYQ